MSDASRTNVQLPSKVRRDDLQRLFAADLSLLGDVRVGVSTSSFQTEGGLDGPDQPATNWRSWQREGRLERIGPACEMWRRFPEVTERCRAMGLDLFRMSLEWSRVAVSQRRLDPRAVRDYAERLRMLQRAAIEPVVTLQHFTHPMWLVPDLWLADEAPEIFERYARDVVQQLGDELVARGGEPPRRILTVNEPNMLAIGTYVAGLFPHRAGAFADRDLLGGPRAIRALDHLLAAHVRAYRAIHAVYAERGWPRPDVSLNISVFDLYGLARMPFDLLRAPERGIARNALKPYIDACHDGFYDAMCANERSPRVDTALLIDRLFRGFVSHDHFVATLDAAYKEPPGPLVDSIGIDIYDPWSHQQARGAEAVLSGLVAGEPFSKLLDRARTGVRMAEPWEWVYEPEVFVRCVRAMHDPAAPITLDVIENGMAERRDPEKEPTPRADGVRRPEYIRGSAFAVAYVRAVDRIPLRTYSHWTLVDNYELGRYAPRFGLFALPDAPDDQRAASWGTADVLGDDAAAVLAKFASIVRMARSDPGGVSNAMREYLGYDERSNEPL